MIPLPRDPEVRRAVTDKYFTKEEWEGEIQAQTVELKRMSNYCGAPMLELEDLPLSLFLLIKRDSWIESMMHSDESREVLKNIWRLQQTEPDLKAIHKRKGGE